MQAQLATTYTEFTMQSFNAVFESWLPRSIIEWKYIHSRPKSEYCQIERDIAQLFSTLQEML